MTNITDFYRYVKREYPNAMIIPMWDRKQPGNVRYVAKDVDGTLITFNKGVCVVSNDYSAIISF